MTVSTTEDALVVVLLGSNLDAHAQLDRALTALAAEFSITAVSARHPSVATVAGAPPYQNQAACLRTGLDRHALKQRLRAVETALGRQRPAADPLLCVIDIDAVGRFAPGWEVWDKKSYSAGYAALALASLGVPPA